MMEGEDIKGTGPDALGAVGAAVLDNGDVGFLKEDGVFGTYPYTATAKVAGIGLDTDEEQEEELSRV